MINVRVVGGLGNQLFQIGVALAVHQRTGLSVRLQTGALRKYAVPRALIADKVLDLPAAGVSIWEELGPIFQLRVARWWKLPTPGVLFVSDRNAERLFRPVAGTRVFIDGYFVESLKQAHFDEVLAAVKMFAKPSPPDAMDPGLCVIHIRGGDFVSLGINESADVAYYRAAIFQMRLKYPSLGFRIVTDDVGYAKATAEKLKLSCEVTSGSPIEDFNTLRCAKHKILSSSTFAFWAAALSDDGDTRVIAPQEWRPGRPRQISLPGEKTRSGEFPSIAPAGQSQSGSQGAARLIIETEE